MAPATTRTVDRVMESGSLPTKHTELAKESRRKRSTNRPVDVHGAVAADVAVIGYVHGAAHSKGVGFSRPNKELKCPTVLRTLHISATPGRVGAGAVLCLPMK